MKHLELGDCIFFESHPCYKYVKSFVSSYAKTLVNLFNFKCIKWPLTREPTIVFFCLKLQHKQIWWKEMRNSEKANRCIFISPRWSTLRKRRTRVVHEVVKLQMLLANDSDKYRCKVFSSKGIFSWTRR